MDISSLLNLISHSSYFIIFALMIIEGPIITLIAGFFASSGYFNIYIIFFLAIFGDLIGDLIFFNMGRVNKYYFFKKKIKKKHIGQKQLRSIKNNIKKHPFKGLLLIKMTPPLAAIGLFIIGSSSFNIFKFIIYSFVISAINKLFYVLIGYFSGVSIFFIINNIEYLQLTIPLVIILIILIFFFGIKLHKYILKKIKKSNL